MQLSGPTDQQEQNEASIYEALLPLFGARILELGCGQTEATRAIATRYPKARIKSFLVEYWAENAYPWLVGMTYRPYVLIDTNIYTGSTADPVENSTTSMTSRRGSVRAACRSRRIATSAKR